MVTYFAEIKKRFSRTVIMVTYVCLRIPCLKEFEGDCYFGKTVRVFIVCLATSTRQLSHESADLYIFK
jgi:hypothetical protein